MLDSISDKLCKGLIDPSEVIKEFKTSTAQRILWTGELALEMAYRAADTETAAYYFSYAQRLFVRAEHAQDPAQPGRIGKISARARIQSAYQPIHGPLYLDQYPPSRMVDSVYDQLLVIGQDLNEEHRATPVETYPKVRSALSQAIGLQAGLLLFWRDYRIGKSEPKRVVRLAHFSEDPHNKYDSSPYHPWHLGLVSVSAAGLSLDYKVQVLNSAYWSDKLAPEDKTVSQVCVDPDLRLRRDQHHIGSVVIRECLVERTDPDHAGWSSHRLDLRTQQLKKAVGIPQMST